MMTQTLALLLDAYRELQAKKMFWIVLILTALVIGLFGILGVNDRTLTVLWYEPFGDLPQARIIYKWIFSYVVVGFWLTWIAALLALISTAGIFPDFLSSGSIDLFLAKPIGRIRLFFTKYIAGLLFVTLQVTIFAFLSFLVLGIRGGIWQPGLFWSIPLIVVFFSYLFAICALFGVWTRSTVAALLLTLLAWFGIFLLDYVDKQLTAVGTLITMEHRRLDLQVNALDARIARETAALPNAADTQSATDHLASLQTQRDDLALRRDRSVSPSGLQTTQRILFGIKSFVPKTRETTSLLDRVLFSDKDLQQASRHDDDAAKPEDDDQPAPPPGTGPGVRVTRAGNNAGERMTTQIQSDRQRSSWWIIGTSLAFEAAILALASWTFSRRDY